MKGCIEWKGSFWNHGYGWATGDKLAHRVTWEKKKGPIPEGLCVLHKCDNRKCVNVRHLWLGTRTENFIDMVKKGRQRFNAGRLTPLRSDEIERVRLMGLANKGRTHTEERKKAISVSMTGKKRGPYTLHKVWTLEEKRQLGEKIRARRLGTKLVNGHFVKNGG